MYAIVRVKVIISGPVISHDTTKLIRVAPTIETLKDYLGLLQMRLSRFNATVQYNSLSSSIELTLAHPRGWARDDSASVQYQIIKW